MEYKVDNDV